MSDIEMDNFPGRARRWSETHVPGGLRTLAVILGFVAAAGLVWLLAQSSSNTAQLRGGPVPVGVSVASKGDIHITVNGLGAVTPLATVTVHPQVSGTLNKVDFAEGQMVAAGQLLAEIDPRPFQAALNQAKGQLARDEAQLVNARVDLARYQALWKANAVSQQVLATQIATVGTDAGTVEADKANVDAAAVNLTYCRITSPVTGRVGLRQVDIGNIVQIGGASTIVVVTQLQPMSVLFTLPEDNINQVMTRVNAGATLSVTAFDRSQTTQLATGVLSNVDNEVDPTTGTVKMRAMFDNKDNALFPSQFVNIRLLVDTMHDQVRVPAAAIQRGASGTYVYVIDKDLTANMRTVTTGATDGDTVQISSGLSEGEKVVVDGADRLSDGATVILPGAKQTGASAGAAGQSGAQHGAWKGKHKGGHHHHHGQGGSQGSGQGGSP